MSETERLQKTRGLPFKFDDDADRKESINKYCNLTPWYCDVCAKNLSYKRRGMTRHIHTQMHQKRSHLNSMSKHFFQRKQSLFFSLSETEK